MLSPRLTAARVSLALALALFATACLKAEPAAATEGEHQSAQESEPQSQAYDATGEIRGIDRDRLTVTIQHGDVPGYMPAMTMPFELTDASQVDGLDVGDSVSFSFRPATGGRHVIVRIEKR